MKKILIQLDHDSIRHEVRVDLEDDEMHVVESLQVQYR